MLAVARFLAVAALGLAAAGCSLISLKTPERPLSARELNARVLTREFSYHFIGEVARCADGIAAASDADAEVAANALRWKIAVATESERAATRLAPMMAVLDTWALAAQMQSFLAPSGAGGTLFGAHQDSAVAVAGELQAAAQELAQRLIAPRELGSYQQFVARYAREHPLGSLEWVRPSVVELWSRSQGVDFRLIDTLGTIPESMADFSERLRISSDALARQTMWRTQLALRESGYSSGDVRAALRQLDDRLERLAAVAEDAPQLVHGAVADLRRSVLDVLDRVDSSSASMIAALRSERAALSADVRREREAIVAAADGERQAIARDAGRITDQAVKSAGEQVRRLAREVLLLLIVLSAVVLGLPFAAGYLTGRARSRGHEP